MVRCHRVRQGRCSTAVRRCRRRRRRSAATDRDPVDVHGAGAGRGRTGPTDCRPSAAELEPEPVRPGRAPAVSRASGPTAALALRAGQRVGGRCEPRTTPRRPRRRWGACCRSGPGRPPRRSRHDRGPANSSCFTRARHSVMPRASSPSRSSSRASIAVMSICTLASALRTNQCTGPVASSMVSTAAGRGSEVVGVGEESGES